MDDRTLPTEEELLAGVMPDGSRPPLHSRLLKRPWDEPLPTDILERDPRDVTSDELHLHIEMQKIRDLDACADYCRMLMQLGFDAAVELVGDAAVSPRRRGDAEESREACVVGDESAKPNSVCSEDDGEEVKDKNALSVVRDTSADEFSTNGGDLCASQLRQGSVGHAAPLCEKTASTNAESSTGVARPFQTPTARAPRSPGRKPKSREAQPVVPGSDTFVPPDPADGVQKIVQQTEEMRGRAAATITAEPRLTRGQPEFTGKLKLESAIVMGERGAKMLPKIAELRAKTAHKLVDLTNKLDSKREFIHDRAHAVVTASLLHLDEGFREVGFGSWMPFRFPDQWLMFCGVMRRVLAANGLIHSEHADVYRRLLEETPPVEMADGTPKQRFDEWKPPQAWGICERALGVYSLNQLKYCLDARNWTQNTSRDPPWPRN